jgi:hypothetical protein
MKRIIMIKYITILIPFVFLYINSYSQTDEWVVPKENDELVSNFQFSDEIIKSGESLYQKNCLSCHGDPTKGNYAPLQPSPGDPASEKFQKQSDGSMFYKITEGRVLMPQFKNILSEKERWEVVAFIRSFNKNYVQPALAKVNEFKGDAVNLEIIFDKENMQLIAKAIGTVKEKAEPLQKAEIVLFAKRYFGIMQINEPRRTNDEGLAFFKLPDDLPGNDSGYVEFIVRLNESSFGEVQKTALVQAGIPKNREKLTDQRAMWNITRMAPVWLLISYFGVVLFVWVFIIYILLQLLKVRKIGTEALNNE